MKLKEFGIGFETLPAPEFMRCARLAEELGFGTFWIPEDYYCRGAFSLASGIASATSKIRIGIGVLNPYTRHPALVAMEFGALDEIAQGRAVLGLGAGVRFWIEGQLRVPYTRPTTAISETIDIVRAMFRRERVSYRGAVFTIDGVRLSFQPLRNEIPIHLGVTGPKNLELAGEKADGVLLGVMTSRAYVEFAMTHIRKGLEKAGRKADDVEVSGYQLLCISENEREARERLKPFLATLLGMLARDPETPILSAAGLQSEQIQAFRATRARGRVPADMVTDQMVDTFALAGSAARCRDNLAMLIGAGLTSPVFLGIPGMPADQLLRDVHSHLIPHFG